MGVCLVDGNIATELVALVLAEVGLVAVVTVLEPFDRFKEPEIRDLKNEWCRVSLESEWPGVEAVEMAAGAVPTTAGSRVECRPASEEVDEWDINR